MGNKTFFSRLARRYDRLLPYDFKIELRPGSEMGMADYLSRFPPAAAPETSYYDESFTIAKIRMINDVLKPRDQLNPRGQSRTNSKNPTVEGGRSCFYSIKRSYPNNVKKKKMQIVTKKASAH